MKNIISFYETFQFLEVKISIYLKRRVFVMKQTTKTDQTAWMCRLIRVLVGCTCQRQCVFTHCNSYLSVIVSYFSPL